MMVPFALTLFSMLLEYSILLLFSYFSATCYSSRPSSWYSVPGGESETSQDFSADFCTGLTSGISVFQTHKPRMPVFI